MFQYQFEDIISYEDSIKRIFTKQPFGRYLSNRNIEKTGAINHEWNNLTNYSKKGNIITAHKENNDFLGFIGFHYSQWDTEVFQKRMALLQYFIVKEGEVTIEREIAYNLLKKFHEWIEVNDIQVVVSKLDTQYFSPIYVLQQNGYIIYETITYQSLDLINENRIVEDSIVYRYARESDMMELRKIAMKSTFKKSHFYLDTSFNLTKVELMYSKWIESALKSQQKIVIIEDDSCIAGVFIYDIVDYTKIMNRKVGIWESAFVDSNFRGKGIGLKLFKATLQSCINNGVDTIESSLVEKNIISQNFHNMLGFRLVSTQYTLHKWFNI